MGVPSIRVTSIQWAFIRGGKFFRPKEFLLGTENYFWYFADFRTYFASKTYQFWIDDFQLHVTELSDQFANWSSLSFRGIFKFAKHIYELTFVSIIIHAFGTSNGIKYQFFQKNVQIQFFRNPFQYRLALAKANRLEDRRIRLAYSENLENALDYWRESRSSNDNATFDLIFGVGLLSELKTDEQVKKLTVCCKVSA